MNTESTNHPQVWRGKTTNTFLLDGKEVFPPANWCFIAAGDPAQTRRLKKSGLCWILVHKRKNRIETLGIWTDSARIESIRRELAAERANPAYQKKLDSARKKREEKQDAYVIEFRQAVIDFLAFSSRYKDFTWTLADAVTDQAVPVGSGTVARTERIPIRQRAEAAVIAWMRHQTTAYDNMSIARFKGERREVRRKLAERSRAVLEKYRSGEDIDLNICPLAKALKA